MDIYPNEKPLASAYPPEKLGPHYPDDKVMIHHEPDDKIIIGTPELEAMNKTAYTLPPSPPPLPPLPPHRRPAKPRFFKRPLFWLAVCVAVIILVVGIVEAAKRTHGEPKAATAGSTAANKTLEGSPPTPTDKDDNDKSTTKDDKPTDNDGFNNTRQSVASSGLMLSDNQTWNMQTYWQDSRGGIMMQMSLDGDTYQAAQNLSLDIEARSQSPLAAVAATDGTGLVYLTLFYMSKNNSIAVLEMACGHASTQCSGLANLYASANVTIPVHNNTGLAAITVSGVNDWRVYYHDRNGLISELMGKPSTGFGKGRLIGGSALTTSSLAAVNVNTTTNNIYVFFVDFLTKAPMLMQFKGAIFTTPTRITTDPVPGWSPLSGLAVCYTPASDQIHFYYTGVDLKIYEFLGSNVSSTNTTWPKQPGQSAVLAAAERVGQDLSAVGWKDQSRFYQMEKGKLIEAKLNGVTWTESFVGS